MDSFSSAAHNILCGNTPVMLLHATHTHTHTYTHTHTHTHTHRCLRTLQAAGVSVADLNTGYPDTVYRGIPQVKVGITS